MHKHETISTKRFAFFIVTFWTESYPYFSVFGQNRRICPNTRKYGYDSVHIRENTGHRKQQGYNQKRKLFRNNSSALAHSSVKNIYNEQLPLKSSVQWYHMAECDII